MIPFDKNNGWEEDSMACCAHVQDICEVTTAAASSWTAFVALGMLALASGPLGVFLMLKRMNLVADALSHGILPGIAAVLLWIGPSTILMTLGGALTGILLMVVSWLFSKRSIHSQDTSFSGLYLLFTAVGLLLLSKNDGCGHHLVMGGSLQHVTFPWFIAVMVMTCCVAGFFWKRYHQMVVYCFDPFFFRIRYGSYTPLYMTFVLLMTFNLVLSFQVMGNLMALGLTVLPALIMSLLSNRLRVVCLGSSLLAFTATALGYFLGGAHMGPLIVGILGMIYLLAMVYSAKKRPL